jgi:hypothetical protein
MMPFIKSSEFLYESATGETEWGVRGVSEKGHLCIFSKANQ